MAHPPPGVGAPPVPIVIGAPTVMISGFPAARWAPSGDVTACGAFLGDPKLVPTRTVLIGGPSTGMALAAKAARRKERKRLLAAGLAKAASMPPGEDREKLAAATERFERNMHGADMAQLAQNVYRPKPGDPPKEPPLGWKNVSNDPAKLAKLGIRPGDLERKGSNYRAQVYEPEPAVFGDSADIKTTVSFKGTDPDNMEDWENNGAQGMDKESEYYRHSVRIGTGVRQSGSDVEITGHSLGGGLASGASRASGAPATTFNAAGLHENTVAHYGGTPIIPEQENIHVYQVEDEFLTGLQEPGAKGSAVGAAVGVFAGPEGVVLGMLARDALAEMMPDALGVRHPLEGEGNPVSRHGMDQVIAGIEAQKSADQALITAFTAE
jgi:hypothetical protein